MINQILNDRYRLVAQIGEGGMATVYKAYDMRLGVDRAIKLLHPDLALHPRIRTRFETEAKTMARLHHKNIVTIYDIVNFQQSAFMVMELLPGGSLSDRIESGGVLQPSQAAKALIDLLSALKLAHESGVIHRDIKPHNVLIAEDGTLKLTDFGIARVQENDQRTRAGVIMGTIAYMAPEQRISATRATSHSDLYSVAATLFVLVTGTNPTELSQPSKQELMFLGLPKPLQSFLRKGCHIDPAMRFQSATEMMADLQALQEELPLDSNTLSPLFSPKPAVDTSGDADIKSSQLTDGVASPQSIGNETLSFEDFNDPPQEKENDSLMQPSTIKSKHLTGVADDDLSQYREQQPKDSESVDAVTNPKRYNTVNVLLVLVGILGVGLAWYWHASKNSVQAASHSKSSSQETETRAVPRFEWIDIKSGSFQMGGKDRFASHSESLHYVEIGHDFQIMKKEVSVQQWNAFSALELPVDSACGDECPAVGISWIDALRYANAMSKQQGLEMCYQIEDDAITWPKGVDCKGYRLPTESEWEFVARGLEPNYIYAGSNRSEEVSWNVKNSQGKYRPPCQKHPNSHGICDLSGNVGEWVWDGFGDYPSGTVKDPVGNNESELKIIRGGAFNDLPQYTRVASRQKFLDKHLKSASIGIRMVRRK